MFIIRSAADNLGVPHTDEYPERRFDCEVYVTERDLFERLRDVTAERRRIQESLDAATRKISEITNILAQPVPFEED